jgi:hypothetical protein
MDFMNSFMIEHPAATLIVAFVLLFGWEYLKNFVTSGFNWLAALIGAAKDTTHTTTTAVSDVIAAAHTITSWAITQGSPDLLAAASTIYSEIQNVVQGPVAPLAPVVPAAPVTPHTTGGNS